MDRNREGWCLDLPLVEERPFTPEEEAQLRHHQRRSITGAVLVGGVGTLGSLAGLIGGLALTAHSTGLMALAFILGHVLVGLCLIQGYRFVEHVLLTRRELKAGTIQRFAGALNLNDIAVMSVRLGKACTPKLTPGASGELLIYGGSGRLIRVCGRAYHGWDIILPYHETAETPAYAAIAAQWAEQVGIDDAGDPVFGGERELSPAELEEMRVYAHESWWAPCRQLLSLAAFPMLLLIAALATDRPYIVPLIFLGFLVVVFLSQIIRGVIMARHLQATRQRGVVSIFRASVTPEEEEDLTLEYLASGGIIWTVHGGPAAWRRSPPVA